jgi:small ligand-binding sensory domain FIST
MKLSNGDFLIISRILWELKAVVWLRRLVTGLSPRRPGFAPGSVHVGLVVDEWHWYRFLSEYFRFSFLDIIPSCFSMIIYHLGISNRPLVGRSSET